MRGSRSTILSLQSALVLLPFVFLLLLGIRFLAQDKLLVQNEAREKAQLLARDLLLSCLNAQTNFPPAEAFTNLAVWNPGVAFFRVNTNNELLFPRKIETNSFREPVIRLLSAADSNRWAEAESAQFKAGDLERAAHLWSELGHSRLPPLPMAIARYNLAVVLEQEGHSNEARQEFTGLASLSASERLDTGLPIAHLASLKLLNYPNGSNFLTATASKLVFETTEYSSFLLRQFPGSDRDSAIPLAVLAQHELARDLHASFSNSHRPDLNLNGTNWYVTRVATNYIVRAQSNLIDLLRTSWNRVEVPSYFGAAFYFQGKLIYSTARIPASESLASASSPSKDERADIYLIHPEMLYARQHQRALWIGGLLASASVVAVLGLVHITRSSMKQQRLSELKSNFVSSVSHELRAPLASMRLLSEGLDSGRIQDPEKQREYFKYLVQECRRLSVLVENVLGFSRIEQNRVIYKFEPVDLRDVVEAAVKALAPSAAEAEVKIDFTPPDATASFEATIDPLALQQAVLNLLDNAIKHSPPKSEVSLNIQRTSDRFEISVTDSGPGIPATEHRRIFDRFYRLGSELRRETPGVGIGLSIVQHIVEGHRGEIHVESEPGHGARFTIFLPIS